jgi:hypothetical protein
MIVDRRELLVGTAFVALAPTLKLLPCPLARASDQTEPRPVSFKIEGWSFQDDRETANVVWLRIGHDWRTAWR